MKTLLLLRHGKAQGDAPEGDRERALTDRGRRDSATMGEFLATLGTLDAIISSDARRARQTAEIAAASAGFSGDVDLEPEIYAADTDDLLVIVRNLPDEQNRVVLVGHNPGFEELAGALSTDGTEPPRLPTAGLAQLDFNIDRWASVQAGSGRLVGIYSPKSLPAHK